MEENPNNMTSQETTSDRNFRRRTRYAQMSPERKQLLLSQLREKRAESKRQKNLHQSNSTAALTISTSSSVPQQGMEEHTNNVPTQQRTSDTNLRRRTRYAQMSSERKQLLLSQLEKKG
uniref:Uncharacterized protein n=2 Tax=Solanum tuberosum TaxID=4113 RepID=M0ZVE2_SOLTU